MPVTPPHAPDWKQASATAPAASTTASDLAIDDGVRLWGLDIARAFAVFGMILVNFRVAMGAEGGALDLLAGKAAATFVVLAGVGISLMARAESKRDDVVTGTAGRLRRRAFCLAVVGYAWAPLWPGDILHFYGAYLLLASFLLRVAERKLFVLACTCAFGFLMLLFTLDYERGWAWDTLAYEDFWTPAGQLRNLLFNGFHPVLPWFAFVLGGMLLGRHIETLREHAGRLCAFGLAAVFVLEAFSWFWVQSSSRVLGDEEALALFGSGPMPPMPQFLLVGFATACAAIGAGFLIARDALDRPIVHMTIACGQLSLTLYFAHVVVGLGVLEAAGWLEGGHSGYATVSALLFCAVFAPLAWWWRQNHPRGPFEAALRAAGG